MIKALSSLVIIVVIVAAGWYLLSGKGNISAATVATVNGTSITRDQLTSLESQMATQQGLVATSTAVQAQFQTVALDSLIGQALIEQEAKKAGVTASSTAVDTQLASIKAQFASDSAYQQALTDQKMTETDLRAQISKNVLLNTYLEQKLNLSAATTTDAEIQAAYKLVKSQQTGTVPPLAQVRSQIVSMIVQQKQQDAITAYVAQLRSTADIKILIATSTPAL
jgi:hypothetical protein